MALHADEARLDAVFEGRVAADLVGVDVVNLLAVQADGHAAPAEVDVVGVPFAERPERVVDSVGERAGLWVQLDVDGDATQTIGTDNEWRIQPARVAWYQPPTLWVSGFFPEQQIARLTVDRNRDKQS